MCRAALALGWLVHGHTPSDVEACRRTQQKKAEQNYECHYLPPLFS